MNANLTPELVSEIEDYLKKRGNSEVLLLSLFFEKAFGRALKINCGACIEEAVQNLKQLTSKKIIMLKFKWTGPADAQANIRINGTLYGINAKNCSDALAEALEKSTQYSHLVERIEGDKPLKKTGTSVKKLEKDFVAGGDTNKGKGKGPATETPAKAEEVTPGAKGDDPKN